MSLEDLKQRYLHIAKNSLQFLKDKGFKKQGVRYTQERGELVLEIFSKISRPWINSDSLYEFEISWELKTTNPEFVRVYTFIENEKNLTKAPLLWSMILPASYKLGMLYLYNDDPSEQDEVFIKEIKEKIEAEVLPWFSTLHSIDDILHITEAENKLEHENRKFYRQTNSFYALANFYAAKGWEDRTKEIIDIAIEKMPNRLHELDEKRKKKYIKYFEQYHS